ncbi:protease modulator HflC [Jiella sp. MQZ9-1]|uniref:Protease modulator HflC n=1 Tax=Jiella flava TaxID=2816857 RepID=A0A939FTM6_9HYPH|nr:protease modulator HflC [Jiella flava]MBO0661733.1 protease modulator HflC [Jiella flava]MCD2470374.1 protease modulator HflC [Jiella flava]
MANRFYAVLIILAVGALLLWNSLFVVNEKEQAIVLRFGEIRRVIDEPGLYFKLPFSFSGADTVQMLPDRLLRFDLDNIRVQVSGGKFYEVDAFLVYNISDAKKFLQTVSGSLSQAEQRLRTRLDAALRRVYGLRGFEAALSDERGEMMRQVRDDIRPDAASLGITIDDVRIRRTDLTQEVSQQTYERMKAERLAEAERLRARGQVAAREIRAAADREVTETVSAARKDAEIIKGQADAERNKVFADAYKADPEFFDFYRSMEAYRNALENSGTTMVLSPDSEFFRYFKQDRGTSAPGLGGAPSVTGSQPALSGATVPEASAAPEAETASPAPAANATGNRGGANGASSAGPRNAGTPAGAANGAAAGGVISGANAPAAAQ